MRGGKRKGAGRKKGSISPETLAKRTERTQLTLAKEAQKELVRTMVGAELAPLVHAQIAHAKGIHHFFLRNEKTKQFERITDPQAIQEALNKGKEGSYYWIFTKDPSVQAFSELMNRVLGKPEETEPPKQININVQIEDRLSRARQYLASRHD